jgi:hypothetical protein
MMLQLCVTHYNGYNHQELELELDNDEEDEEKKRVVDKDSYGFSNHCKLNILPHINLMCE